MKKKLKFHGQPDAFRLMLHEIDPDGSWSGGEHGAIVYRTAARMVVTWWPKTGTILIQGPDKSGMRDAIIARMSGSGSSQPRAAPMPKPKGRWHTIEMILKFRQID